MVGRILTLICALLLAAHSLRSGNPGSVTFWLLAGVLGLLPQKWCGAAAGGLLVFGSLLWLEVCLSLVHMRVALEAPWMRLGLILGTVILLTFATGICRLVRSQETGDTSAPAKAVAFLLTVGGLAVAKYKTSLDIILIDRFFPTFGWVMVFLLGCYSAWITGKMLVPGLSAKWRKTIWSVFSAVFFIQLLIGLAGFEQFLMTGKLHLPVPALIAAGPIFRGEGFFMIILFSVTLLLVGPAWCSHLCYIGAWDNLSACSQKRARPLPARRPVLRGVLTLLVPTVALLMRLSGIPVAVALIAAAGFGLVGVVLMLTWSRRTGSMAHCTAYCPMGLPADIFGRINPWRVKIANDCTRCGVCSGVCRYDALRPENIEQGKPGLSCSLCGDCISGCPHGMLHYTFPGLHRDTARTWFIVMVSALHAVFLGVARL